MAKFLKVTITLFWLCGAIQTAMASDDDSRYVLVTFDYHVPVTPWQVTGDSYISAHYESTVPRNLKRLQQRLAKDYHMRVVEGWVIKAADLYCVLYEFESSEAFQQRFARLERDRRIAAVEALAQYTLMAYSDPLYEVQFPQANRAVQHLHGLGMGKNQRIGIVDSGIDTSHPDLQQRVVHESFFLPRHHQADLQHGTAVAGVIAANANNHEGIVGMAPQAKLYSYQACGEWEGQHRCTSFSVLKALAHALKDKVDVLNLSLAGQHTPLVQLLVDKLLANQVTIVAASNGLADEANFPASHPQVIAVEDTKEALWFAKSPRLSTRAGGGYQHYFGSSVGAAGVSGLAAVLREQYSAEQTRSLIQQIQQECLQLHTLNHQKLAVVPQNAVCSE